MMGISLKCFGLFGWLAHLGILITHVFKNPFRHLAPEMKACIIHSTGDTVIFVRVIGTFKINIAFDKRRDHLCGILKMHVVISRSMYQEKFALDFVRMVNG